jgi:hypothetical protein
MLPSQGDDQELAQVQYQQRPRMDIWAGWRTPACSQGDTDTPSVEKRWNTLCTGLSDGSSSL